MGFFEQIGEKITTGANTISNSAKKMAGTTKINSEINANTNQIDKLMKSIGVAVKARLMDTITDEEILQLSAEIDELIARNSVLNEQLKELRGISRCLNCGKDLTSDSMFCPYCGTKVESNEPVEAAEEVVVEEVTKTKSKICPSCGFVEVPDADYCSSCGARLS